LQLPDSDRQFARAINIKLRRHEAAWGFVDQYAVFAGERIEQLSQRV
jgi:hypothetical protein